MNLQEGITHSSVRNWFVRSSDKDGQRFNGESYMQYTEEELKKILENHQHWLKEDCDLGKCRAKAEEYK